MFKIDVDVVVDDRADVWVSIVDDFGIDEEIVFEEVGDTVDSAVDVVGVDEETVVEEVDETVASAVAVFGVDVALFGVAEASVPSEKLCGKVTNDIYYSSISSLVSF